MYVCMCDSVQVEVMKADQEQRGGATPYRTSTRGIPPPLVTTDYLVQDDGKLGSAHNNFYYQASK